MKVVFRVDSSYKTGSGHIMRCIAMAEKLKYYASVSFISRNLKNNINHIILQYGFDLIELDYPKFDNGTWLEVGYRQDAEDTINVLKAFSDKIVLITDHYELDSKWEKLIKPYVHKIVVIDDLGNREHCCDILIDNSTENGNVKYKDILSSNCIGIYGRQYQIFRDEFLIQRENISHFIKKIEKVLVFFGGTDPTRETLRLIKNINFLKHNHINFFIIVGESNPQKHEIENYLRKYTNTELLIQIPNMAECLTNVDICFGAAGVSNWERVFLQVPSFCVSVVNNQKLEEKVFDLSKPYIYLGHFNQLDDSTYEKALEWATNNIDILNNIKQNASNVFNDYNRNIESAIKLILKE